ncbi:GerMN domain-containing protein [Caloramator sp. E03]|uniref:GerMN domain-containing protein n=1 Tax=Caloramator sp. E03 TaxID=2576307 RepID=UPI0011106985|nr:GerMN domain-containing protein [Caloramator sp. E03]QCX34545.1 GerMN domain-containing protein [Caloramator sp. E03]
MKKILITISILLLFISCSQRPSKQNNISSQSSESSKPKISDYFPFTPNIRMQYEGIGNEYAEKDVYVDYINNNRIQLRVINPGTVLGQVIENKDGQLRLIASIGEFYNRDDLTSYDNNNPEILLKEPLEKGTTWTLPDGNKRYISNTDVNISVPYGTFKALEVTTEYTDSKTYDYYVLNLGHVKTIYKSNDFTVETNLSKFQKDASVTQTIKFYYPNLDSEKAIYIKEKINFKTNDRLKDIFEKYFKKSPKGNFRLMSNNTKINKLYLNRAENKVYIDFSKEFISEMNAGSALEGLILLSVTNTLGDYYNVDKVYITIEGKPYSSGHFEVKEGEPFYVDYKKVMEYK